MMLDLTTLFSKLFDLERSLSSKKSLTVIVTAPSSYATPFLVKVFIESAKKGMLSYYLDVKSSLYPELLLPYKQSFPELAIILRFKEGRRVEKFLELISFYNLGTPLFILINSFLLLSSMFLVKNRFIQIPYILALLRRIAESGNKFIAAVIEARNTNPSHNQLLHYILRKVDRFIELKRVNNNFIFNIRERNLSHPREHYLTLEYP